MALYNLDNLIFPGAAARNLMISSDGTLPYVDTSGTEPLAEADTVNAGKLLCSVGTLVKNDNNTMVAQLGPDGWVAVTGTLPDEDDAPEEAAEQESGN